MGYLILQFALLVCTLWQSNAARFNFTAGTPTNMPLREGEVFQLCAQADDMNNGGILCLSKYPNSMLDFEGITNLVYYS